MDYSYVMFHSDLVDFGVPANLIPEAGRFRWCYNDYSGSSSALQHIGEGWFVIYDYPLAEQWARESSWKPRTKVCQETSYTMVYFEDLRGAVEFKMRWHRA